MRFERRRVAGEELPVVASTRLSASDCHHRTRVEQELSRIAESQRLCRQLLAEVREQLRDELRAASARGLSVGELARITDFSVAELGDIVGREH
ncbi:MAG: hypothetical protein QOJ29_5063 [Thermoleophilaceae bacterium]|nr:hypothetical protein [Thermoleophilaceae bacterium]